MEVVGAVIFGVGWLPMAVGSIWLIIIAFSVSVPSGPLSLFVPFYSLYFMISHWNNFERPTRTPGKLVLAGIGLMILGPVLAAVSAAVF